MFLTSITIFKIISQFFFSGLLFLRNLIIPVLFENGLFFNMFKFFLIIFWAWLGISPDFNILLFFNFLLFFKFGNLFSYLVMMVFKGLKILFLFSFLFNSFKIFIFIFSLYYRNFRMISFTQNAFSFYLTLSFSKFVDWIAYLRFYLFLDFKFLFASLFWLEGHNILYF